MSSLLEGIIQVLQHPLYSSSMDRRAFLTASAAAAAAIILPRSASGGEDILYEDAVKDHTKRQPYLDCLTERFAARMKTSKEGIMVQYHHTPLSFLDNLLLEGVIDEYPEFSDDADKLDPAMFPALGDYLDLGNPYGFFDFQDIDVEAFGDGRKRSIHALPDLFKLKKKDAQSIMMLNFSFAKGCKDGYRHADLRESDQEVQFTFIALDAFDTTLTYAGEMKGPLLKGLLSYCEIGLANNATVLDMLSSLALLSEKEACAYSGLLERIGPEKLKRIRGSYKGNKDLIDGILPEYSKPDYNVPDVVPTFNVISV